MSDSGLAQGENSGSSLYATLGMATAGAYTGSANLSLARHNGGMTDLSLVNNTPISLSGKVYQPAVASIDSITIDFGTGRTEEAVSPKTLAVTNTASSAALSDVLTGSFSGGSSLLTASGYLGVGLAPGVNSGATLQAQLSTANAGTFNGTATRSLLTCRQKCPFIPL